MTKGSQSILRLPEIGDYILKAGASTDKGGEKVLFHCLTSINGIKEHDLQVLKAKHGVRLYHWFQ